MRFRLNEKISRFFSKNRKAALPFLALALAAAAIVLPGAVGGNRAALRAQAQDLMQGVKARPADVSGAVTQEYLRSTQNFAIQLFKEQYQDGKNNLFSPASAYFCLGMVANGAGGETQKAFANVLGKYGMTMEGLDRAYKAYADDLAVRRGSTGIVVSNSIWLREGLSVKEAFLQTNADYFGAGARTLDFGKADAAQTINDWVARSTKNRIDKLINHIDADSEMFLVNTLTFDAKWESPFDTDVPAEQADFHTESGGAVPMRFMNQTGRMEVIHGASETGAVLPYDDGRFALLCVLPKEGTPLRDYVAAMDENTIPSLLRQGTETGLFVRLPQFTVRADETLNGTLQKMGLSSAFSSDADFSGMTGDRSLVLSQVRQKTYLAVDELGTKAAAATEAEIKCTAVLAGESINFNRPFLFAVADVKTGLPLFIGTMQG